MRVLILGASGMAGHTAAIYFREKGHKVTGFAREALPFCETITGNALEQKAVQEAVTCQQFDAVINCLGVLNKEVDRNIPEGILLNSYLPHFLAECLKDSKTKLIQISTDCVFSGKSGGYGEDSFMDCDSLYGRTKALGEIRDSKNLTFRTSIVGPDLKENGIGLLNWFLKQEGTINGFTSAFWTGVSTITLAQALEEAIKQDVAGLYHLVNDQTITKYELLQMFNRYLRKSQIRILPDDSVHVDKSLINHRRDFLFTVPSYEQMVRDTRDWIQTHRELYPHYHEGGGFDE